MQFKLQADFKPTGDQPEAIEQILINLHNDVHNVVLLGVTGSGKTFTIANVIEKLQLPTLVISHNKTLAAQLTQEFKEFFPKNAVEYFVSYYDYYQPEAYIPQTDTYIEKEATINEEIDRLRLSATTSLSTRNDVIVCASVSCIYNIGSPQTWQNKFLKLSVDEPITIDQAVSQLVDLFYERADFDFKRGTFRVRGDTLQIYPSHLNVIVAVELKTCYYDSNHSSMIKSLKMLDPVTFHIKENVSAFNFFPSKHHITQEKGFREALAQIRIDLDKRIGELNNTNKKLEAHRLEQKVNYDLEMIQELGYCSGIENYSRYFDGRKPGEAPYTLLDYFSRYVETPRGGVSGDAPAARLHKNHKRWLLVIDESHMTIPQIRGMYRGDLARKRTLIDYGFRLPSAIDNRPLRFEEFLRRIPQTIYMSATPGDWELNYASKGVIVEQLIRPTGLIDPTVEIRPIDNQIPNLIGEIRKRVLKKERVLVTTLTKRMAEALSDKLQEENIKAMYLHADVATLERTDILSDLRSGKYDVLVGINLLREGLDLPEVSLVAILDADKEGFLRSKTSLIQVMGRAARHINGAVIMYADKRTESMRGAITEVNRRRNIQLAYNKKHRITPKSIVKPSRQRLIEKTAKESFQLSAVSLQQLQKMPKSELTALVKKYEALMKNAADDWAFEEAAFYRDELKKIAKALKNVTML